MSKMFQVPFGNISITAQAKDLIIREVTIDDISGIMRLNNELYDYNWNRNFYLWLYVKSVFPTTVMAALANGEVVGTFGVQKRRLTNNVYLGQIIGINIANKWRGQGLFSKLAKETLPKIKGLKGICIFSNKTAVPICKKCLKMNFIGELSKLTLKDFSSVANNNSFVCEKIDNSISLASSIKTNDIMFEHSEEFRIWKFSQSPVYTYYKISISSQEYTIVKIYYDKEKDKNYGDIIDIECNLEDDKKLQQLFGSAIKALIDKNAVAITTWANPNSLLRQVLERIGFRESNNTCYFGISIFNRSYEYLYHFCKWHLVQADATNY